MLINLIMQIAQIMQISIRHFPTPQTMYITFILKDLLYEQLYYVCNRSIVVTLKRVVTTDCKIMKYSLYK